MSVTNMYKFILNIILLISCTDNVLWARENNNKDLSVSQAYHEQILQEILEGKGLSCTQILLAHEHDLSKSGMHVIEDKLDKLYQLLKAEKEKTSSETQWVRFAFAHIKKNYLVNYKADADFSEMFGQQNYDCVTGTTIFALLFERLDVKYEVLESYSHVCIKVLNDSTHILLEPTLKDGVYTKGKQIYEVLKKLQNNKKEQVVKVFRASYKPINPQYYFSKINLTQLIGILYFNKAAQGLTKKQYALSMTYAKVANMMYPSPRTHGFLVYSMDNLLKDDTLDYKSKITYYKKYKYLINESLLVLK